MSQDIPEEKHKNNSYTKSFYINKLDGSRNSFMEERVMFISYRGWNIYIAIMINDQHWHSTWLNIADIWYVHLLMKFWIPSIFYRFPCNCTFIIFTNNWLTSVMIFNCKNLNSDEFITHNAKLNIHCLNHCELIKQICLFKLWFW